MPLSCVLSVAELGARRAPRSDWQEGEDAARVLRGLSMAERCVQSPLQQVAGGGECGVRCEGVERGGGVRAGRLAGSNLARPVFEKVMLVCSRDRPGTCVRGLFGVQSDERLSQR